MEPRIKANQTVMLRKNGSLRVATFNHEPTLSQQQFKAECDINNIVKNYSQTGVLPVSNKVGKFLDVSNISDYQSSLETVFEAQKAFDDLPSNVRSRFENDPNQLLSFLADETNYEEALSLKLINSNPLHPTTSTPPSTPTPTPTASIQK